MKTLQELRLQAKEEIKQETQKKRQRLENQAEQILLHLIKYGPVNLKDIQSNSLTKEENEEVLSILIKAGAIIEAKTIHVPDETDKEKSYV